MNKKTIIEAMVALGVLISLIVGGMSYFATAEDVKLVEVRLDQKIVADAILQISSQMWQIENRNYGPCETWQNETDKETYRRLQLQLDELKARQDALIKG